jgi:uncharacterized integral membrane protein
MSQSKNAKNGCYENILKKFVILLMLSLIFISFNDSMHFVLADETDPFTIYGTVLDENRVPISGASISLNNLNTQETNSNGNDTITGNPILVVTDSEGRYTFELLNLKNGYSNGDEILVSVEIDGISKSKSIRIYDGDWGARVDISLETGESQNKESWYGSLAPAWILLIIVLIVIIILILAMFKKRKPKEVTSPLLEEEKEILPSPPPWMKPEKQSTSFHVNDGESQRPEDKREPLNGGLTPVWIMNILSAVIITILKLIVQIHIEA